MGGSGTAAEAARVVGPAGKRMNVRIAMGNGLCVFMVKVIWDQGWSRESSS
jgi:hypothetical protein